MAVLLHHYYPTNLKVHVQLNCYVTTLSNPTKKSNWDMLNLKVLIKINCKLTKEEIENVVECKPGGIELVLLKTKKCLETYLSKKREKVNRKELQQQVDQILYLNPQKEKKYVDTDLQDVIMEHVNKNKPRGLSSEKKGMSDRQPSVDAFSEQEVVGWKGLINAVNDHRAATNLESIPRQSPRTGANFKSMPMQ
jgi:hypothetical protein